MPGWRALIVAVGLGACRGGGSSTVDAAAAQDGALLPDAPQRDGAAPLTWVDFTVTGCAVFDEAGPTCHGPPPLTLRFASIAPTPVDSWLWDFGDLGASTEPTPEHEYDAPGAYTVTLAVGGEGGTAQAQKEMFVVVDRAPVGAPCVGDVCAAGLECVCGGDLDCPASLRPGMCTRACNSADVCGEGAVCADLSPGPPDTMGWRRDLCLRACDADADCGPYRCRELRAAAGGGWVRGCFAADLLLDDGSSCRDAAGDLDDTLCASGRCLVLGARGLCAGPCGPCPSYAACATFTSGGAACLARCDAVACDGDPWLGCEAPDPSGPWGFTVTEVAAAGGYCAPRRCASAGECAGGTCPDGFCEP